MIFISEWRARRSYSTFFNARIYIFVPKPTKKNHFSANITWRLANNGADPDKSSQVTSDESAPILLLQNIQVKRKHRELLSLEL